MVRINLPETIERITFPENVWEWLDFFGDVLIATQQEAANQDKKFIADTPFKKILLCSINKDLSTLNTIYILLRCEYVHQASSHVRLFCESLITLKYISLKPESRSELFWGYSDIESYEIASSIIEWEKGKAKPLHVEKMGRYLDTISEKYKETRKTYKFTNKKGRTRPFINWCNKNIALQSQECGTEFHRLYELVYKQMSSYVHGSSWSLRRQTAYSRDHHDAKVILTDIATIIRTALVVWIEWAKFCISTLNWGLVETIEKIPKKIEELESKHFKDS